MLTSSYPRGPTDSAGAFVREFCLACRDVGLPVTVLAPATCHGHAAPQDPGVVVRRLSYAWPSRLQFLSGQEGGPEALARAPWRWGPALAFSARLALALRAQRRGCRAVVSHWLLPAGAAASLAALAVPHVVIVHGSDLHLFERLPARGLWAAAIARRASRLVFVSPVLAERFRALVPAHMHAELAGKVRVQPMGVSAARVRGGSAESARRRLGLDGNKPVALFMGRLVPVKGPLLALEAVAASRQTQLVVAGDGPLRAALSARTAQLGLEHRVRFAGVVTGALKADLLAAADVLLLPSVRLPDGRADSLPVSALEALVAGLPVVTTESAEGLVRFAPPQAALRLSEPDPRRLAEALGAALEAGRLPDRIADAVARAVAWPRVVRCALEGLAPLGHPEGARD